MGIGEYGVRSQRMQTEDSNVQPLPGDSADQPLQTLSERFSGRLRVIAKLSVTYWFNREKLDKLLAQYIGSLEGCELIYAVDQGGHQVSSNISPTKIENSGYGQDLSQRPYVVSLSVLSGLTRDEAFVCNEYVSKVTGEPCFTVMYGVSTESSLLGFIAADFGAAREANTSKVP
jgi:hypothetical protein